MEIENIGSISNTPPLTSVTSTNSGSEEQEIQASDDYVGQAIDILA